MEKCKMPVSVDIANWDARLGTIKFFYTGFPRNTSVRKIVDERVSYSSIYREQRIFWCHGRLVCNGCSGCRVCRVVFVDGLALVDYNRGRCYHVRREKSCRIVVSKRMGDQHRWKSEKYDPKNNLLCIMCVLLVNSRRLINAVVPLFLPTKKEYNSWHQRWWAEK